METRPSFGVRPGTCRQFILAELSPIWRCPPHTRPPRTFSPRLLQCANLANEVLSVRAVGRTKACQRHA
jgi:hypothetical protein